MEKLTIKEASQQFGLSRARLYQLLDKGVILGHKSMQRGRRAGSWIDSHSLSVHIENRLEKQRQNSGRPSAKSDGMYVPVAEACNASGYSAGHIYRLLDQHSITAKKNDTILIYLPDLLRYKETFSGDKIN